MKFAKEFETALATAGFDQQWIDTAVPYGQLKKVIKKVARELKQNGLDPTKLAELHELVKYGFDGKHARNHCLTLRETMRYMADC